MPINIKDFKPSYIYHAADATEKDNIIEQAKNDDKEVCWVGYGKNDLNSDYIPSPIKEPDYYMRYCNSDNYDYLKDYKLIWGYGIGMTEIEVIVNTITGEHLAEGKEACDTYIAPEGITTKRGIWLSFTGTNNNKVEIIKTVTIPDEVISIKNLCGTLTSVNIVIENFNTNNIINFENAFSGKNVTFKDFQFNLDGCKNISNIFKDSTITFDNSVINNVAENIVANNAFENAIVNSDIDKLWTNYIGGERMFAGATTPIRNFTNTKFIIYSNMFYKDKTNYVTVEKSNNTWKCNNIIDSVFGHIKTMPIIDFSNCTNISNLINDYSNESNNDIIDIHVETISESCIVDNLINGEYLNINYYSPENYTIQHSIVDNSHEKEEENYYITDVYNIININYSIFTSKNTINTIYGIFNIDKKNNIYNIVDDTILYKAYVVGENNTITADFNGMLCVLLNTLNSNSNISITNTIKEEDYNYLETNNYHNNQYLYRYHWNIQPSIIINTATDINTIQSIIDKISFNTSSNPIYINNKVSNQFNITINLTNNLFVINNFNINDTENDNIKITININNDTKMCTFSIPYNTYNLNSYYQINNSSYDVQINIFNPINTIIDAPNCTVNIKENTYSFDKKIQAAKVLNCENYYYGDIWAIDVPTINCINGGNSKGESYLHIKNDNTYNIKTNVTKGNSNITKTIFPYCLCGANNVYDENKKYVDFRIITDENNQEIDFYHINPYYKEIKRSQINKFYYSNYKYYSEYEGITYIDDVTDDIQKVFTIDNLLTTTFKNIITDLHDWIFYFNNKGNEFHINENLDYNENAILPTIYNTSNGFKIVIDMCANTELNLQLYNRSQSYLAEVYINDIDKTPNLVTINKTRGSQIQRFVVHKNKNINKSKITTINLANNCETIDVSYCTELDDATIQTIVNRVLNVLYINEICYAKLTEEQFAILNSKHVIIHSVKNET